MKLRDLGAIIDNDLKFTAQFNNRPYILSLRLIVKHV